MKGFLKRYFENLKIIAILLLLAFVVIGIFGVLVWALFHYTNFYIGIIVTYLLSVVIGSGVFTALVYDGSSEENKEEEDKPDLPFMPKKDE